MRLLSKFVVVLWLGLAASISHAQSCVGELYNPIADTDWNNLFPITVLGVRVGPNSNPPLMYMPPVCVCPGIFGIPSPGIGVTFWQPLKLVEIARTPGCLSSLGGVNILPGYGTLASEQNSTNIRADKTTRMQIHLYEYPLFAMLDLFTSLSCFNVSGFNLAYMTEFDPTWQDDLWGVTFSPEAALFSNLLLQGSCVVDAIASNVGFPLDTLFWCAGSWGNTYPLTGNAPHYNSSFTGNNLILGKFIARQARLGLEWQTIGPSAKCFSHPSPIWVKSQYRVNQVGPIARRGKPVTIGSSGLLQLPPIANLPTREHTVDLLWQGQQCCLRAF